MPIKTYLANYLFFFCIDRSVVAVLQKFININNDYVFFVVAILMV